MENVGDSQQRRDSIESRSFEIVEKMKKIGRWQDPIWFLFKYIGNIIAETEDISFFF